MSDTYGNETPASLVPMKIKKLALIVVYGAVAGLVAWALTMLLDTYIYKAILCNRDTAVQCASSYLYASTTSSIIGAAVGLFGLVRLQVFRPLLIVIASFVALWALLAMVSPLAWYYAAAVVALLYGAAFGVFAWFARIRRFYLTLILVVLLVVAVRLILNS
jgi:hypothetical protein